VLIDIGHEKLTEMSDDRPTNVVICDPLNDGLGLDIAQLFQWNLLQYGSFQSLEASSFASTIREAE
jgi:hypothetical protein